MDAGDDFKRSFFLCVLQILYSVLLKTLVVVNCLRDKCECLFFKDAEVVLYL